MDQQTTGPDCLTSDLAGLAAREAGAPARGPTRIEEIRARLTPRRAEDAAAWDPDADGCVCAECMKSIRLLEGFEWTNGEDVCDECAVALIGHLRADAGYLLNELAGYQSDLLAGERALKEARRERDALRDSVAELESERGRHYVPQSVAAECLQMLDAVGAGKMGRGTQDDYGIARDDLLRLRSRLAEVQVERDAARSAALDAERAFEAMRAERDELLGKRVSRVVYDSVCEERDIAMTALADAEAEIRRGRPGYSWIGDDALAALTEAQAAKADLERERDALRVVVRATDPVHASHERFRRIVLAVIDTLGVRYDEIPQDPDAAAEKAAAMVRRTVGTRQEDGAIRRVAGGPASPG